MCAGVSITVAGHPGSTSTTALFCDTAAQSMHLQRFWRATATRVEHRLIHPCDTLPKITGSSQADMGVPGSSVGLLPLPNSLGS